jgi:hypothetical protein
MPDEIKTEFNMGQMEFERLQYILFQTTQAMMGMLRKEVVVMDPTIITTAWGGLNEFYIIIEPLMGKEEKGEFDRVMPALWIESNDEVKKINRMKELDMVDKIECPMELYWKFDTIRKILMRIRQRVGAGIPARKNHDAEGILEEMEEAIGRKQ